MEESYPISAGKRAMDLLELDAGGATALEGPKDGQGPPASPGPASSTGKEILPIFHLLALLLSPMWPQQNVHPCFLCTPLLSSCLKYTNSFVDVYFMGPCPNDLALRLRPCRKTCFRPCRKTYISKSYVHQKKISSAPQIYPSVAGIRLAGATSDVHILDVRTGRWDRMDPAGEPPSPRAAHAAAAVGSMVVVQVRTQFALISMTCLTFPDVSLPHCLSATEREHKVL